MSGASTTACVMTGTQNGSCLLDVKIETQYVAFGAAARSKAVYNQFRDVEMLMGLSTARRIAIAIIGLRRYVVGLVA